MDENGERIMEYRVDTFAADSTVQRVLNMYLNVTCWLCATVEYEVVGGVEVLVILM